MRPRGAVLSPRHKLAASRPFRATGQVPDEYITIPTQVNAWGNTQYGDCVTAEEFAAKAVRSLQDGLGELYWPEEAAVLWARDHGYLNGAVLTDVMDAMAADGVVGGDGKTYHDGPYKAVDWTDPETLRAAIYAGPVKAAVDATPYEAVVGSDNGWLLLGDRYRANYDHCVSVVGYGQLGTLAQAMGVPIPAGVDPTAFAVVVFTWGTFGLVDHASLINNCAEAWVRLPTTPEEVPAPEPAPPPPPPPPPPVPGPSPLPPGTYQITGTVTLSS